MWAWGWAWMGIAGAAAPGEVTLPLEAWEALRPEAPPGRPREAVPIDRRLVGRYRRGLLEAELTTRIQVSPGTGSLAVPVLGATSTVSGVTVDGGPAIIRTNSSGQHEVIGDRIATAGTHTVRVALLHGEQTDRFARRLTLQLPPGGPTEVELVLPEAPVVASLAGGALVEQRPHPDGTLLRGWLGADGRLELTWERRATHTTVGDAQLDTRAHALLEIGEDVVTGLVALDFEVLGGETDRLALTLPSGVEILDVTGPDVMQWHTDGGGGLAVLLRSVVDRQAAASVRFQYPAPLDLPVPVLLPLPSDPAELSGAIGIAAPVSLGVELGEISSAEVLQPRDVPSELLDLTEAPLRAALEFGAEPPEATVEVSRQAEVTLSPSRIDDLQGISVVMEDGAEVGKLRLAVRNTARQVLTVDLPPGAALTHCFRDGVPLRPAADDAHPDRVLIPLTRSALDEGPNTHTVASGDTLSAIALDHFGDASLWPRIQSANPVLLERGLQPGMVLTLPRRAASHLEESFVLELGFKRRTEPLGSLGRREIRLPTLDLDVMAANWHVYLPDHVQPLAFDSSLIQRTGLHIGPLSKLIHAIARSSLGSTPAYAGGDSYRNILADRRSIYRQQAEVAQPPGGDPFPLVGVRYRFSGVLLGTDPPALTVLYLTDTLAGGVAAVAGLLAALLAGLLAQPGRSGALWSVAGVAGIVGLGLGHYVLGVYSQIAWGACGGLFLAALLAVLRGRRFQLHNVDLLVLPLLCSGICTSSLFPFLLLLVLGHLHRRLS